MEKRTTYFVDRATGVMAGSSDGWLELEFFPPGEGSHGEQVTVRVHSCHFAVIGDAIERMRRSGRESYDP